MNDNRNPSEGEDHPSDDETDPMEAKQESKLSDRKLLYQELDSLIIEACQHPPDSFARKRYLSKIVIKMKNSGLIWQNRRNEPFYEDAVQEQWCFFGFSPTAESGELVLSDLGSLDDFLMHLEYLSESKVNLRQWLDKIYKSDWESVESVFNPPPETVPVEVENPIISNLRNWWANATETGRQKFAETKQNVEDLLFPDDNLIPAYRGGVHSSDESASGGDRTSVNRFPQADATRAKLIDLGMRLGRTTVALLVAIAEESDRTLKVYVQLHPAIGESYLPRNIKLSLISDIGKNLSESQSRIQDKYIVLKNIEVDRDESFSIRVALDDFSIIEKFMV